MKYFQVGVVAFLCWLTSVPAGAAQSASCASKFIGSWTVRVEATGQTYPAQILPNGRTQVSCPMCTPGGSWTCAGDTITVNVDNGVVTHSRLHPDGKTMSGGCCTLTRSGAAPAVASGSGSKPASRLRLPGALSVLTPQTARADDGSDDWQKTLKKIKFSPSALGMAQKFKRKALRAVNTCADVFEKYCLVACGNDEESCAAKASAAGVNQQSCNDYKLQSCQPGCEQELKQCQGNKKGAE